MVIDIKIYIDVLIIINFICDFIILQSTNIMLKRNAKISNILLSALFGSASIFIIFLNINVFYLLIIKLLLGSIIILIAFKYKNFKYFIKNLLYFFINSLVMGGLIYYLNLKIGNNFLGNELLSNFIIFVIFSPIILYIYMKTILEIKQRSELIYYIEIEINSKKFKLNGYYDSGNKLIDPYKRRPIIIVNKDIFEEKDLKILLVPYVTISGSGLLKCFKPDNVFIKKIGNIKNVLIALSEEKIKIDGVDCLINKEII